MTEITDQMVNEVANAMIEAAPEESRPTDEAERDWYTRDARVALETARRWWGVPDGERSFTAEDMSSAYYAGEKHGYEDAQGYHAFGDGCGPDYHDCTCPAPDYAGGAPL